MTARILDGKATAAAIKEDLSQRVAALTRAGTVPGLGTVLVGDDPGSHAYVAAKHRDCAQVGIASIRRDLPADATQQQVEAVIDELNADPACTGYIVQLPLPPGIDGNRVLLRMDPAKDADGLHPINLGRLVLGEPGPLPATPRGIVELLRRYDVPVAGADVTVIGRGITVGRTLGLLLTRRSENATVTLTHTGTKDLPEHTRRADIVVAAAAARAAHRGHGPARRRGAGRRHHPDRLRAGGRRRARGGGGGRLPGAGARRGRADDPGDAAGQRGGRGRAAPWRVSYLLVTCRAPDEERGAERRPAALWGATPRGRAWPPRLAVLTVPGVAGHGRGNKGQEVGRRS